MDAQLFKACLEGSLAQVREFISDGANVNYVDQMHFNVSPLLRASFYGHTEIMQLLIDNGANVNHVTLQGRNALFKAVQKGQLEAATLLIKRGIDINLRDSLGRTPLNFCIETQKANFEEMMEILIDGGADVNQVNDAEKSPLWYASEARKYDLMELLLIHGARSKLSATKDVIDYVEGDRKKQFEDIIKNNEETLAMLKGIVYSVESAPWMQSKLMIVGQGRAGKTTTVRTLLGEPFRETWESTIGASVTKTKLVSDGTGLKKVHQRAETAGYAADLASKLAAKELQKLGKSKKGRKKSKKSFLGKEENQRSSSKSKIKSLNLSGKFRLSSKSLPKVETSAVIDDAQALEKKKIDEDVTRRFETKLFLTTHSKKDENEIAFTVWDYGGQKVFYSLHHLFLTKYGVYVLVFDMREMLQSEENMTEDPIEYLKFWMNSIRLHAPVAPLLLVGTYGDVVKSRSEHEKVQDRISETVGQFKQVVGNNDNNLCFFPINNKSGDGKDAISAAIEKETRKQAFVNTKVPLRWLHTLDRILDRFEPYITFNEVREMAKTNQITSHSEVTNMLSLFHELGVIIYMPATAALANIVTKDPQWLIDCIGKVIRDPNIHGYNDERINKLGYTRDVDALVQRALVSQDLLEYLWRKDVGQVDFLIDLMQRTMLLSKWNFKSSENRDRMFLVPSMIEYVEPIEKNQVSASCDLKLNFNEGLPTGVYERLVCLCVAHSGGTKEPQQPKIGNSSAVIWFGKNCVQLSKVGQNVECAVESKTELPQILSILTSVLKKVNADVMNGGLKYNTLVDVEGSWISVTEAKEKNVRPWADSTEIKKEEAASLNLEAFLENL